MKGNIRCLSRVYMHLSKQVSGERAHTVVYMPPSIYAGAEEHGIRRERLNRLTVGGEPPMGGENGVFIRSSTWPTATLFR